MQEVGAGVLNDVLLLQTQQIWPMLATSLTVVAQWLENLTGVLKVMGSIPVGDWDFFFVPHSRHAEYSIFSYFVIVL